jgi:hypothetical protein
MSSLQNDPPFGRGRTADVTSTQGVSFVGVVKEFLDENPNTGIRLSNNTSRCKAVRNTSAGAILPGSVVRLDAADLLNSCSGNADNTAGLVVGVADEYLPAAGCAVGDIFWVVVSGPTTVKTTSAAITQGAAIGTTVTAGSAASGSGLGFALVAKALNGTTVRAILGDGKW